MQQLLFDLRYSVRQLTRSPGFTATIVFILALGIGITTAVVSAVDHVLLRPLDLPDSERLVTLCEVHRDHDYCTVSPANATDWAAHARTVAAVGVARWRSVEIHHEQGRTVVPAAMATPGFFTALGVPAAHGRLLGDSDMMPLGTASVIMLTHELWQEQFGGDPAIVGTDLRISSGGDGRVLNDDAVRVIGILPPGTDVPQFIGARAWIPLQFDPAAQEHRDWRGFIALARLAPHSGPDDAAADLNRVHAALAEAYPDDVRGWSVTVHRLRDYATAGVRPLLLLFLGAVALVLTIICVNVVTLLLARATRRERELNVLVALGAGRGRLTQQLLIESLLLAVAGGVAGILVATWLVHGLVALAPAGIPRLDEVAIDGRIIAIIGGLTLGIGLIFGVAPAARLRYARLHDVLKQGRTSTGGRRAQHMRRGLVVTQLALALALLFSATLLMRSFSRLAAYDPGFSIDGVLTFQVYPPMWRYDSRERLAEVYDRISAAVAGIPGVTAVGSVSAGPLFGGGDGNASVVIHGRDPHSPGHGPAAEWFNTGPGYFEALGVPLVVGRPLSPQPVRGDIAETLINETMARRHWPNESPVGARLSVPTWDAELEVVGVVRDLRPYGRAEPPMPALYVSNVQRPRGASFFVVRTSGEPELLAPAVRRALTTIDGDMQVYDLASMRSRLSAQLSGPRFNLALISVFALLAVILSTAGVYALMAYTVVLRTREFGIRLALGARASQVLTGVLLDSAVLLAAGLAAGGVCAFWFTHLLRGFIHDVAPADPIATSTAVLLISLAAFAAAAVPALRAARTEPATVLNAE
jgi:putative ABC transport system permease protein